MESGKGNEEQGAVCWRTWIWIPTVLWSRNRLCRNQADSMGISMVVCGESRIRMWNFQSMEKVSVYSRGRFFQLL